MLSQKSSLLQAIELHTAQGGHTTHSEGQVSYWKLEQLTGVLGPSTEHPQRMAKRIIKIRIFHIIAEILSQNINFVTNPQQKSKKKDKKKIKKSLHDDAMDNWRLVRMHNRYCHIN